MPIPFPFELTTPRLIIRPPSAEDARQLAKAIAETLESLKPWMPWAQKVPTLDEARENCANGEKAFREGADHRLHLFLKDSFVFIGGSGLHRVDWSVPKCEIGYWIRKSCKGQGYVTEAVREVSRYALEKLSMARVEIRMSTRNLRSRRVAERLGFDFEGVLKNDAREIDGALRNTCVFSKTQNVPSCPLAITPELSRIAEV